MNRSSLARRTAVSALALASIFGVAACSDDDDGEQIENETEDIRNEVEDETEDLGDEIEEETDELED